MATLGYHGDYRTGEHLSPAKSAAAVVAIIAALVSFYLSSQRRELWGLFAALVAIAAGLLGAARAMSPRVSGGLLSISAIVLGAIAILVALVALIV